MSVEQEKLEEDEDSQIQPSVRNNIVKIIDEKETFHGTGFFIFKNDKKYCITCHHCIYNVEQIKIQKRKGKESFYARWIEEYSDPEKDIAVLEVEECPFEPLLYYPKALPNLPVITWGYSGKKLDTFPEGMPGQEWNLSPELFPFEWPHRQIVVKQKWNMKPNISINVFQYSGKFELGFSGAPVCYKEDKKVIGIFIAKDEENGYVLSIGTLLKKFDQNSKILSAQSTIDTKEYLEKGNLFYEKRNLKKAIEQYNKIIAADVNYLNALSNKGKCLSELGKNLEAIELFRIVLDINPNFVYALTGMSDALNYLGKFEEAIEWCEKALKIDPNNSIFLSFKGLALGELKRHEAIEWCEKALKIDPENVVLLNNKGLVLDRLGRYEEAIEWYDKVLKIDPDYVFSIGNKGSALKKLGKYEEAIEWYDKALKIDPDYVYALTGKGSALDSLEKHEEAIVWYDKALKFRPDYTVAQVNKKFALEHLSKQKVHSDKDNQI